MRYLNTALVACATAFAFYYARDTVDAFLVAIGVQAWIAARNAWTRAAGFTSGPHPEVLELLGLLLTLGTWAGFAWVAFVR